MVWIKSQAASIDRWIVATLIQYQEKDEWGYTTISAARLETIHPGHPWIIVIYNVSDS